MLNLIGFALRYLPLILSAIAMVEKIVDKDTPGADKKAVVMQVLKEALARFNVTVTPQVEIFISQVIDIAVTILNLFGVFKHTGDSEEVPDEIGVVSAEKATKVASVIKNSPTEARLNELEALIKAE
jgi:uncharacterized membrane protein